jgi:cell division protein FtsL
MHSKEKQTLVTLISSMLVMIIYAIYVYQRQVVPEPELINNLQFWGKSFLLFIPVAIVAMIVVHIIFAIINKMVTNEDLNDVEDERDRLIELRSVRISHWIFTAGFLLAMASQAIGMQTWVMMVTFILSGLVSSLASELAKIIIYKRGF